jgi:hypothetical protein
MDFLIIVEMRICKINENEENNVWFKDSLIFCYNNYITIFIAVQTPLFIYIKFSSNLFSTFVFHMIVYYERSGDCLDNRIMIILSDKWLVDNKFIA